MDVVAPVECRLFCERTKPERSGSEELSTYSSHNNIMKSPGSTSSEGKDYLEDEKWHKMGTKTSVMSEFMEKVSRRMNGSIFNFDEDQLRVLWLSSTLFFTVGGYWLLRSLKDPVISIIDGVDRIPQAKIASLFVVLFLVVICELLLIFSI